MKLYTEKQVNELRRALKDVAQWDEFLEDDWEDAGNRAMDALRCFEKETPIELPSEKEVANSNPYGWKDNLSAALSWQRGAEYVIRLIKGDKQ